MIGNKLRKLRLEKGVTQRDIAELLGVSPRTISSYETDISDPPLDNLKTLANYFNVTVDYMMDLENTSNIIQLNLFPDDEYKIIKLKIYDVLNFQDESKNKYLEDKYILVDKREKESNYFGIRIKTDQMVPFIREEDIGIIKRVDGTEEDIYLLNYENRPILRKVKYEDDGAWLIPINPKYNPEFFTEKELKENTIEKIGKVIEIRRKF